MLRRIGIFIAVLVLVTRIAQAQDTTTFTVRIENISGQGNPTFSSVAIFGMPVGATQARPAMPGEAYEFTVRANPGDHLSFATMYGESNDTFFATDDDGIALFDDNGNPVNGDVTDQVMLWDAGTEVNEPLGQGANQAPRQPAPNTGEAEGGVVQPIVTVDDGFTYPDVLSALRVTITNDSGQAMNMMAGG